MPHNELVFACKFSNALGPIDEVCSRLKLGSEYRLRPIENFGFSFPESTEAVLVAELTFGDNAPEKDWEKNCPFFPPESMPLLEKSSSVLVLVRVSLSHKYFDSLTDVGFRVTGTIRPRAKLTERAIRASFPVGLFVKGPIPPAIVIGRANVNLLAQVRALGECGISVYCILTRDESPLIARSSRYVEKVIDCRGRSDDYVANCISEIAKNAQCKPVLYTGGDLEIGLLSRIWARIEDLVLAPNNPELAKSLNNKSLQIEQVQAVGIKTPLSRLVKNSNQLNAIINDFYFPVICKPTELEKKGAFIGKTFFAKDPDHLKKRIGESVFDENTPVLIQEYIPGGEDNILFAMASCNSKGEATNIVTGRKLLDDGRGCIGLGETTRNILLKCEAIKAFKALGVGGVNGVEFKLHDITGELFYIEANFRAENFFSLAKASGVNLSVITFLEIIGYSDIYSPLGPRKAKWMDFSLIIMGKIRDFSGRNSGAGSHNIFRDRNILTDALWIPSDPAPALMWYLLKSFALAKRALNSVLRFK